MAESCIETPEAPAWLSKLERQREKLSKARLGHDSGAGASCNLCGPECPGLDLHFWRKVCRACHCSKDVHDVQDDTLSGWAQFELLGTARPKRSILPLIKIRGVTDKPVKLDWIPPNASTDLVSDYMSCLGEKLAPVTGSEAARRWRAQLRTQLPPHDVSVNMITEDKSEQEKSEHQEYITRIKDHVVGMGSVVRVGNIQKGDVLSIESSQSHVSSANKSYALPFKVSNVSRGVKYNTVPKITSDKKLVLDGLGNVINSAANLSDFKSNQLLSPIVKDKLLNMRIESDRIKSAVEHGPIYDKLFKNLNELNVPIHDDVYMYPIKQFRDEYHRNPQFRDETTKFASQNLGANIIQDPWSSMNNNQNSPLHMDTRNQKGTIFGPNGEVWSWKHDHSTPEQTATVLSMKIDPLFSTSMKNRQHVEPQKTGSLKGRKSIDNEDLPPPPPLNYSTYPGYISPEGGSMVDPVTGMPAGSIPSHQDPYLYPSAVPGHHYDPNIDPLCEEIGDMSLSNIDDDFQRKLHGEGVPCQRCKIPMFAGQVAVKAERAGNQAIWHPQCFTCNKCGELLADLVYFFFKGEIYCARDLANVLEIPRCAGCDELIFTRPYTAAEGRAFHIQHFCCYHCDAPLGGNKYVPDDKTGLPVCLPCYDKFHAEKCSACKGIIGPEQQGVSWTNLHWHATCFICSGRMCGKSLLSGRFVVKENMPFCSVPCVQSRIK